VGDPLKDTSGPSLNIVMKLMAIISLVFADYFVAIYMGHGLFKAAQ
jgi:inorganic pyrophosphatase